MTSKSNLECDHFDVCHIVHTRKDHKCPSDPQNKSCDYDTRSSKSPAATIAWAIKAPDWHYVVNTRNDTEEKAWGTIYPELREIAKSRGYRCVRVTVQEMQE